MSTTDKSKIQEVKLIKSLLAHFPLFRYKVFLFFYEYKEKKEKDEMKNEDQELSSESAPPSTNEAQSRRNKK